LTTPKAKALGFRTKNLFEKESNSHPEGGASCPAQHVMMTFQTNYKGIFGVQKLERITQ
jgi:hypothetical protein